MLVIHCYHCLFCLPMSVPVPCASGIPYSLFHLFPVSLYSCLTRSYLLHVDTLGKRAVNHPASFKSLLKMSLLTKAVSGKGEGGQTKKAKRWPQPGDVTKPLLNSHSYDILPCIFLSSLFIYNQYLPSCSIHIETNLGKGDCVLFRSTVPSEMHGLAVPGGIPKLRSLGSPLYPHYHGVKVTFFPIIAAPSQMIT